MAEDFDYIIIGSGFGGSVAAMRLSQKGYRVAVIEAGRRYRPKDFPKTNWNLRKAVFFPWLGLRGILRIDLFKGLALLTGAGVGGGSLVYANTLIQPSQSSFKGGIWPRDVGVDDWERELFPFYRVARKMLGVTPAPTNFAADEQLHATATELGYGETFRNVDVAVHFGEPNVTVPDPYFGGSGPPRTGCTFCGGCMVGCRYDAKNTLDKNYLFFAEKHGATVIADMEARLIRKNAVGFAVDCTRPGLKIGPKRITLTAKRVIVAAGVIGTLKLLMHCKRSRHSLPDLSPALGRDIRTNSESLIGVRVDDPNVDFTKGLAICSSVHPAKHTAIEAVRYPAGSNLLALLATELHEGKSYAERWRKWLKRLVTEPRLFWRFTSPIRWAQQTIILLVMQSVDSKMRFVWRRSFARLGAHKLKALYHDNERPPVEITEGNAFAKRLAARLDGKVGATYFAMIGKSVTAHILGGCPMGQDRETSVIDGNHEVHGYPGLFVLGGASVPANLGVNPSLTITAMAERAMKAILYRDQDSESYAPMGPN